MNKIGKTWFKKTMAMGLVLTILLSMSIFNVFAGEEPALDKDNLKDGKYTLNVEMLKLNKKDKSMSNNAIDHQVTLEVEKGKYLVTIGFKGMKIGPNFGYLGKLEYYLDGYKTEGEFGTLVGKVADAEVLDIQKEDKGNTLVDMYNTKDTPYPKTLRFPLVDTALKDKDGFVPLKVMVPIMESIAPGNGTQDVYVKIDWSTLKLVKLADPDDNLGDTPGDNNGNTPGHNNHNDESFSPAVDVVDEVTGIRVHAGQNVLPKGAKLIVSPISEGEEFMAAKKLLSDITGKFQLFEIHFLNEKGEKIQPNGIVEVSYLVPKEYNADSVQLYRINDDNTKTLIKGMVENGYYTVKTKSFSKYALADGKKVDGSKNKDDKAAKIETGKTPKTGDSSGVMAYTFVILLGSILLAVSTKKKWKSNKGN